jgi:GNAT superfamily N-acetyltransferase
VAVRVGPAPIEDVRVLRQRLLRPHQRADELKYEGDDHPDTLHAGAFLDDRLVAIATIAPDASGEAPGPGAWRLRGMAIIEELRGAGLGRAVLERCLDHARERGARVVWCNARTGAIGFYERLGFEVVSEVFDVPVIGPHVRMVRRIA